MVAALLLAGASGCVGPSRSTADYREKAANAAEAMTSAVSTARLVVQQRADGQAPGSYTALVLSESESDARSITTSFEAVQPPDAAADRIRVDLAPVLSSATDLLTDVRIAARRDDADALARAGPALAGVIDSLRPFVEMVPT